MKKTLFMFLAATALVSCSQDEVMEVAQKEAISFKDAFVDNATRAIDGTLNTGNLTGFKVYGNTQGNETNAPIVPIFVGVDVTKSDSDWNYAENLTQYWIEGNAYKFAAVVNGTVTTGTDGLPASIAYDASTQNDLLYATQTATGQATGSNSKVAFTFDHLLAKAQFTVKNTMTTNTESILYTYRVSDVKITNAYQNGTYTVGAATPWAVNGTNNLAVEFGHITNATNNTDVVDAIEIGKVSAEDNATSRYQKLLIPTTYGASNKLNITCKIETLLNHNVIDVQNYSKDIEYTFAAGHAYNFVISRGNPGDPIQFTVTAVKEWVPATGGTDVNM